MATINGDKVLFPDLSITTGEYAAKGTNNPNGDLENYSIGGKSE